MAIEKFVKGEWYWFDGDEEDLRESQREQTGDLADYEIDRILGVISILSYGKPVYCCKEDDIDDGYATLQESEDAQNSYRLFYPHSHFHPITRIHNPSDIVGEKVCIYVDDREESRRVQEVLFGLGYKWAAGETTPNCLNCHGIYIYPDSMIACSHRAYDTSYVHVIASDIIALSKPSGFSFDEHAAELKTDLAKAMARRDKQAEHCTHERAEHDMHSQTACDLSSKITIPRRMRSIPRISTDN